VPPREARWAATRTSPSFDPTSSVNLGRPLRGNELRYDKRQATSDNLRLSDIPHDLRTCLGALLQLRRAIFSARIDNSSPSVRYPKITSMLTTISPIVVAGETSPKPSVVKVTIEK
jgi:hypothetical protein